MDRVLTAVTSVAMLVEGGNPTSFDVVAFLAFVHKYHGSYGGLFCGMASTLFEGITYIASRKGNIESYHLLIFGSMTLLNHFLGTLRWCDLSSFILLRLMEDLGSKTCCGGCRDRNRKTRAKLKLQVNHRLDFETQQSAVI